MELNNQENICGCDDITKQFLYIGDEFWKLDYEYCMSDTLVFTSKNKDELIKKIKSIYPDHISNVITVRKSIGSIDDKNKMIEKMKFLSNVEFQDIVNSLPRCSFELCKLIFDQIKSNNIFELLEKLGPLNLISEDFLKRWYPYQLESLQKKVGCT